MSAKRMTRTEQQIAIFMRDFRRQFTMYATRAKTAARRGHRAEVERYLGEAKRVKGNIRRLEAAAEGRSVCVLPG